jgi:hypothetical protein
MKPSGPSYGRCLDPTLYILPLVPSQTDPPTIHGSAALSLLSHPYISRRGFDWYHGAYLPTAIVDRWSADPGSGAQKGSAFLKT